ncbi:MAG: FxsA family protein [Pseudomonadota bacterium]
MFFALVLLFVIGPIAEIYVLLSAGAVFGVLPVVLACIVTAILGGWIIRLQGLAAMNAARRDLETGRPPVSSAVDGALLVVAAPFLMTPGFLTDAVGFALLIPAVRRNLGRLALAEIRKRIDRGDGKFTIIRR